MEEFMDEYGLTDGENKVGRSSYSPRSMLKLIVYAKTNHVTCSDVIADYALYHDVYKYVCDYITPSAKSIRRFKRDFKSIYNDILKKTLKKAEEEDLTSFNHIPVDGTIKKAYNNLHNIITEKETDLLLEYYNGE
jgi:transposase